MTAFSCIHTYDRLSNSGLKEKVEAMDAVEGFSIGYLPKLHLNSHFEGKLDTITQILKFPQVGENA